MKKTSFLLLLISNIFWNHTSIAQRTILQYLSGTDKDHTVRWDFLCTKGRNSGKWSTIAVPANWEQQGFGTYNYYKDFQNPDEQGLYKYAFNVAPQYKNKRIFIVFDAAMTDAEVTINGRPAGPMHQGGFYQFKYDITGLLQFDRPNLLEVTVSKHSSNASINGAERKADFWLLGGIFRPVYLEIVPTVFIERVAIDAQANGDFNGQVFSNASSNQTIEAQVYDLADKAVDSPFQLQPGDTVLAHHFAGIKNWNPETPNLYYVKIAIKEGAKTIHEIRQRFGFRTAELRPQDGFYVNGVKVIFKGVCRHSEWPETGRTLSRDIHLLDIRLIKDMNMNAVRMSHYPPDKEFLDLCDSLGLFVLDELTGWQAAYDTVTGRRLVKELVVRDVNHPSIVLWDNGNEGGWNRALDHDYALYDPQKRHVIHPWERFDGTNTKHYPDFKYIQTEVANAKEVFFPTEFMHGLFDGGQGAALDDFWTEMMKHPHAAGGFLWSFHDEGLVRGDRHDSIDVAGNQAPDGIVGPHREKEGSYYTIKNIWSPVYVAPAPAASGSSLLPVGFDGTFPVENRYLYTNLRDCRFEWKWVAFPGAGEKGSGASSISGMQILQAGLMQAPALAPGEKGVWQIPVAGIGAAAIGADALYLLAYNAKGDTICTWSWALHSPADIAKKAAATGVATRTPASTTRTTVQPAASAKPADIMITDSAGVFQVSCDGIQYRFDPKTGLLVNVVNGKQTISLGGGPSLAGTNGTQILGQFRHSRQGNEYIIEPIYKGDSLRVKWIFQKGRLPKLEYSYLPADTVDFMGITFNYPEEKIKGMRWMGRGPYRVWKNREKGPQLGVWEKAYNNTITGENWDYPEFKGWHAELYWVTLQNKEADFTVYTDRPAIYLGMLQPEKPGAAANNNTSPPFPSPGPPFPAGNIGFMNAISAIGTKFQRPEVMGPQSQRTVPPKGVRVSGALYFDFR
ncbi:MAG TPA: glycoside hydrolase family 2 TIM barrel-domain containing protein [Puia sp.]|nr:glycoside hydrolase family 2 TIM barrel-domain containing protein [Puia sp.]